MHISMHVYDVFKGVSMSLRLKCVFIRQNISQKAECVLLLKAVYIVALKSKVKFKNTTVRFVGKDSSGVIDSAE